MKSLKVLSPGWPGPALSTSLHRAIAPALIIAMASAEPVLVSQCLSWENKTVQGFRPVFWTCVQDSGPTVWSNTSGTEGDDVFCPFSGCVLLRCCCPHCCQDSFLTPAQLAPTQTPWPSPQGCSPATKAWAYVTHVLPYWTRHWWWLNFTLFLPAHSSSLFRSLWKAALLSGILTFSPSPFSSLKTWSELLP